VIPAIEPIGSPWDVQATSASPEGVNRPHLTEWVEGSAIHPALAAANLESIDAYEALARTGQLARLGPHANHYVTPRLRRLLDAEPWAGGGWWCSGLDPLNDWAPLGWGVYKPDRPRWDRERNRPRKYEHPAGAPARLFWLRVPAVVAQRVADRFDLALPPEVAADVEGRGGAFWRWWTATPALPLLLTEGAKKAGALLSIGIPTIAAPGIWNPSRKGESGRAELLPELAAAPLRGRPCWVLFDHSDRRNADEPKAARRLGRLLERQGATVLVGTCPGPHKGADDHLAAGGSWEELAAALAPLTTAPVLPRLRQPDVVAPAGQWLGVTAPIPAPDQNRLVALAAGMGAGKTDAIAAAVAPLLQVGTRVVLLTHRRALGAALAERLGLPWADEAAPGSDLRQSGIALCIDSLCAGSALRFRAADWKGAAVVIDEAAQVLLHALMGNTAVADRRPQVLAELAALLEGAAQVIAADAQLNDPVLTTLERITGARALLIGSEHRPAAGRTLTAHTRQSWRLALVEQLQARRPLWIATTAQEAGAPNSAQNLAALAAEHWPGSRVLVVDSQTVNDPEHPASRLAADPDGIAPAYDVVVATPAIAAGVSVTLKGHFKTVFCWAGGTTDPAAVAQAAARVRDDCPRHMYAPERSPGGALKIGSGSTDPTSLLLRLKEHEAVAVPLLLAAGGWSPTSNAGGPWLPLWGELACLQNAQRLAFCATVLALLEREGYRVQRPGELAGEQLAAAKGVAEQLQGIAERAQAAEDLAIRQAEPLTDQEAEDLRKRQRLRPEQRAQLQRWRIAKAWALGAAAPTAEQIEAHREGVHRRLRFGWMLRSSEARTLVARADLAAAKRLAPTGAAWAPDLCAELEGPRITAAEALGLPAWLERSEGEWFGADDPALLELQALATGHASSITQVLGITPGMRATTTLRQLLALAGYRLEAKRARNGEGRRAAAGYWYRVVPIPPPAGVDAGALEAGWLEDLRARGAGVCTNPPL
jgi:hypothetical protein